MNKLKYVIYSVFSIVFTLFLAGCNQKAVVWHPKGLVAADEKTLFITALWLILIIVVPTIIFTLVIARRYRASNQKAKYDPSFGHSNKLEAIWWLVPIIIVSILAVITWKSTHKLNPYRPLAVKGKMITIEAVALRWRWLFIYPKQHIATINYIEFPVNQQVRFLITADAPMNSFQIPALGGQIYAMNGMQTKLHLIANYMGTFRGRSVSFSGAGFTHMVFHAKATTYKGFANWVSTVKHSHNVLTWNSYSKHVSQPTLDHGVKYFSSVTPGLFSRVIHKFMKSDSHAIDTSVQPIKL